MLIYKRFFKSFTVLSILLMISCSNLQRKENLNKMREAQNISQQLTDRHPASLNEQMLAIDVKKPTVCTVTLNSTDEREIFRKSLPNFNHIELADVSDQVINKSNRGGRWLENACNKGVKCDILVVSGHFAGTFWTCN